MEKNNLQALPNAGEEKSSDLIAPRKQTHTSFPVIGTVISVIFKVVFLLLVFSIFIVVYILGIVRGYALAGSEAEASISQILAQLANKPDVVISVTPTPLPSITKTPKPSSVEWGGPELWEAVNKRRIEYGVNPLNSRSELCTIASIRLNELLDLGKLDGHEGFSNLAERRSDLKPIFDKYGTVAEFLAMGGQTPSETVSMWENTLGHSQLLKGGEYVWGCIYAQNTFSVAITAF